MKILGELQNNIIEANYEATVKIGGNHDYRIIWNSEKVIIHNIDANIRALFKHDNDFNSDTKEKIAWELFEAIVRFDENRQLNEVEEEYNIQFMNR